MGSIQQEECEDSIITTRGDIVENRHLFHAAVVDSTGKLLYTAGNPLRVTLWRSAAKPAQALAILETGCLDQFKFDDTDLALICASHNAEDRHVSRANSMLQRIGAKESDLRCGPHPSVNQDVVRQWLRAGFEPTPVYNNCSGKHSGMLAGAKAIDTGFETYHLPDHPMQARVREVVEDLCGDERKQVQWGIDGCNLPAPATPLQLLARTFATFAAAADSTSRMSEQKQTVSRRTQGCSRIFHAMTQYPEFVAGNKRFCTELMTAYEGSLIGKVGAEGCYGIGVRESEQTGRLGAKGALGISAKVEDGNMDILYSAVVEILDQLQIGAPEIRQKIESWRKKDVLNTAGVVSGSVRHAFEMRSVTSKAPKSVTNG